MTQMKSLQPVTLSEFGAMKKRRRPELRID